MRSALLVFLVLALPLPGATFVPPQESRSLFRRDLLPIDADTMRSLSAHLTTLAHRDSQGDPAQLRATAQMLAVAIRLDPANRPARDLARHLAAGKPAPATKADLDRALRQTWRVLDWLLQEEAGAEGQLLGHQLLDALRVVDPRDTNTLRYDPAGEAARWRGVVAELARFQEPEDAGPNPQPGGNSPARPGPGPEPDPKPEPPVERPPILLSQTSVQSPFFLHGGDLRLQRTVVPISMEIIERDDPAPLTIELEPVSDSPHLATARERVRNSLLRTWPALPINKVAVLKLNGMHYARRNETAIAGPASLLLHAALSGKKLRDDVVFLSGLGRGGRLQRPLWSWDYLRALRLAETGGRLLVPPDMQAELRAMIALEDPGFFLKWEVLVVSSMDAALSLASVGGDPEGLAATSRLFVEMQELRVSGKDVGQLCVNQHVRGRLAEIVTKAPFHYSAGLLLVQGSAQDRPTRTERAVTARIVRSAVEPLTYLTRVPLVTLSSQRALSAAGTTLGELGRFKKFFSESDLDLYKEALAVARMAEQLGHAKRDGIRLADGTYVYRNVPVTTYHTRLQDRYSALLKQIAPFTGETIVASPPEEASTP